MIIKVSLTLTMQPCAQSAQGAGEPKAAVAAAVARQDLGALVICLETLSGVLSSTLSGFSGGRGGEARQAARARKLLSLVTLLQPYVAGDAAAVEPELPSELASVDALARAAHCPECLLDVLLTLLARPASPLPSALLRDAVEDMFSGFSNIGTHTGPQVLVEHA